MKYIFVLCITNMTARIVNKLIFYFLTYWQLAIVLSYMHETWYRFILYARICVYIMSLYLTSVYVFS